MGLHHDGAVEAFWLQLEGRRSVTLGPPVRRGTPLDLPDARARDAGAGWRTLDLTPGTLLYLPERTPHRVVYHGRSVAVSLTWGKRRRVSRAQALTEWDVVSGRAAAIPPLSRKTLWTQLPAVAGPLRRATRQFSLHLPDGQEIHLPMAARPATARLSAMPSWRARLSAAEKRELAPLIEHGILAPRDLPLRLVLDNPRALDGWRFA
jgi:hypothetical protein